MIVPLCTVVDQAWSQPHNILAIVLDLLLDLNHEIILQQLFEPAKN